VRFGHESVPPRCQQVRRFRSAAPWQPETPAGCVALRVKTKTPPLRALDWPVRSDACADAGADPFFALLQKNVLNRRRWETRDELRIAIVSWIELTYHRRLSQERLGRLTPIEFELIMTKAADQAASSEVP
jgi:transposase InsO family protein